MTASVPSRRRAVRWPLRCSVGLAAMTVMALVSPAFAQTIEVEGLDAAKAFAPGIDVAGELPRSAWTGTDANTAIALLEVIQGDSNHPIVSNMRRRVVLAGLSPPVGAGDAFDRARIEAAQDLATPDEYEQFAARNPAAHDPHLRAEAAIAQGGLETACTISDTITQGRGESFWVRLRAACHELRGETALAELARDLLRDRGETAELVVPEPPKGFWVEVMALGEAELIAFMDAAADWPAPALPRVIEPEVEASDPIDLNALPADDVVGEAPINLLPPADDLAVLDLNNDAESEAEPEVPPAAASAIDLGAVLTDETDRGTARLFRLGLDGDAKAVSEFVRRAKAAGLDANRVLARIPALLDPTQMAVVDLPLFARYAVATGDIPLIQALFVATEDPELQQRLALASDALGSGYYDKPLGDWLEMDLETGDAAALGDVMIALGLGARLSARADAALRDYDLSGSDISSLLDWIAVDQALDRGAQAETLLRLATLIPDAGTAGDRGSQEAIRLYRVLKALRQSGFSDLANRLAAYEFLRGL